MPQDPKLFSLGADILTSPQKAFKKDDIPRTHSFSLGDFHDYDRCVFRFFVNHHLEKKYELAEGNVNQTIGTLLDLSIKKLHQVKAYDQPIDYLVNLVKSSEMEIRADVASRGLNSFYGSQLSFLTPEVIEEAKKIFRSYYLGLGGKVKKLVETPTLKKSRPFWKRQVLGEAAMQLWGGPDAIEWGGDGVPEVVDYKYFENSDKGQSNLDMDLMPKIYILLTAEDLLNMGFAKARFKVRFWQDPSNEAFYEEFDLPTIVNLENFFKDKMERILRTAELSFCDRDYCKACQSPQREVWIAELQLKGWVKGDGALTFSESPDLPF